MENYSKKGYLTGKFKIFHLSDENLGEIDFHYHDFHKILIHLSGNASYSIEGRNYNLLVNDIVFVKAGEVHRPVIHDGSVYERIIMYISPDFLEMYEEENNDLALCFKKAGQQRSHVIRVPSFYNSRLGEITRELEASINSNEYAKELYHEVLFLEFMIQLNRTFLCDGIEYIPTAYSNQKITEIIDFLNKNLTNDVSIDELASNFYMSRYHLMHSFKDETGYTIGNYITTKRLAMAQSLIRNGYSVNDACYKSGFNNYSTFSRAYKKTFGCSPRENNPKSAALDN